MEKPLHQITILFKESKATPLTRDKRNKAKAHKNIKVLSHKVQKYQVQLKNLTGKMNER